MKELYTVLFLAANSWLDFRSREISLVLAGIYGISGIMYSIFTGRPIGDILIPAGIGTVGVGDGWILAALGTLLSTEIYVQMLCMGLFFAAGWSGVLLAVFGKSRKTEIPLVPFLLAGYIGAVLL